ncbi:MAG TPA: hypothetical protein VN937_04825 [Blastocatellia bacterium]|nr:hypothetical protein [Blastocatellia bacterium]
MGSALGDIATAWPSFAGIVFVPTTEEEYNRIVAFLDQLIDEVGEDETHPLASLMDLVGVLIEHYETHAGIGATMLV